MNLVIGATGSDAAGMRCAESAALVSLAVSNVDTESNDGRKNLAEAVDDYILAVWHKRLLLSSVGIYGVMSYAVSNVSGRSDPDGNRSPRPDVLKLVLRTDVARSNWVVIDCRRVCVDALARELLFR